jgi:hypothetical protein
VILYWELMKRFWWLVPVTAILVTAGVFRIQRDHARDDLMRLRATLAAQEAIYLAQLAQAKAATREAQTGYEAELERLRRAAGAVPVVRLCPRPAEVPGGGTAAGGAGGSGTAGGGVSGVPDGAAGEPGADYGPGLYALADDADRRAAQLRHVLERARKLSEIASQARP